MEGRSREKGLLKKKEPAGPEGEGRAGREKEGECPTLSGQNSTKSGQNNALEAGD